MTVHCSRPLHCSSTSTCIQLRTVLLPHDDPIGCDAVMSYDYNSARPPRTADADSGHSVGVGGKGAAGGVFHLIVAPEAAPVGSRRREDDDK